MMEKPASGENTPTDNEEECLENPPALSELRRKSFVSTSVVSSEPSIEQSKEWINNYLDGGPEEDDFQRKFFEGGLKIEPVSPNSQAKQILKEENKEQRKPDGSDPAAIIETYEQVLTPAMMQEADRRKRTYDNMEDKDDASRMRSNKSIEIQKKKETLNGEEGLVKYLNSAEKKLEVPSSIISTPKSLPQMTSEILNTDSPILGQPLGNEAIPMLKKQRSKSNNQVKNEIDATLSAKDQPQMASANKGPIVKLHPTIKIKIFDLGLVREHCMNKTDDEVRHNFLKTLQVKQKMPEIFSPKPHTKEQKSRRFLPIVIIFDWDDTLFCTSYLSSLGYNRRSDLTEKEKLLFKKVDESAVG